MMRAHDDGDGIDEESMLDGDGIDEILMLDLAPYIDVSRCVGLGHPQAPSALAGLMMLEDLEVDILLVLESACACLPGVSVSLSSHLGAQTWGSKRPGLAVA